MAAVHQVVQVDVIANALDRFLLAGGLDIEDSHTNCDVNVNVLFHSALPPIVYVISLEKRAKGRLPLA